MANSFNIVFSNYVYVLVSVVISLGLFFPLSIISEYLFLEPYFIFSIYSSTAFNFSLILILSVLAGIVVAMNIFRVRVVKRVKKIGSSITGTIIGASAGACSCGPIGFSIITTFGTTGSIATAFLNNYETPLRLFSIAILLLVLVTTMRSIPIECKIN